MLKHMLPDNCLSFFLETCLSLNAVGINGSPGLKGHHWTLCRTCELELILKAASMIQMR